LAPTPPPRPARHLRVDERTREGYFPPMPDHSFDFLVVGGGVIGSSVAHFLSASPKGTSFRVGVVEPDPTYSTSSTALSVGGIRQQFSTPENVLLSSFGAEFFRSAAEELAVGDDAPDLSFVEAGYLFLATEDGMEILKSNHALQSSLGSEVRLLTPTELRERFPWLEVADLAGGRLGLRGEGWVDPYSLLQAFRKKAISNGVEYIQDRVGGVEVENERVTAVRLDSGRRLSVGAMVNAAGPRAAEVAWMAGILEFPVRPRKRFVYRIHCREAIAGAPLTIDPTGVYFRPEGPDFLCGVSPQAARDPDTLELEMEYDLFHEVIWPTLARRIPAFGSLKLGSSWAGHYAVNTLDRNAILGPHPRITNFFFANGFSGHGLQHSPGVGRALSELVLFGEYRTINLERFGFHRLASGDLIHEENVV
jgi:FAD-dependent oxidoreductase domain-containing protein 1